MAANFRQAYARIQSNATTSFEQKQRAFRQYAEAAIAANNGVASSELKLQAQAVQLRLELDENGKTVVRTMAEAEQAIERAAARFPSIGTGARQASSEVKLLSLSFGQLGAAAEAAGTKARKAVQDGQVPSLGGAAAGAIDIRDPAYLAARNRSIGATGSLGDRFRATPKGGITRTEDGQLVPPDDSGDWFFNTNRRGEGPYGLGVWELTPEAAARREAEFLAATSSPVPAPVSSGLVGPGPRAPRPAPPPQPVGGTTASGSATVPTVRLELAVGGRVLPVTAPADLAGNWLAAIERAKRTGG